MQRLVDNILAVTKESVKIFTYESLNNVARLINGFSAILLAILPGKGTILEGIHGWELRPTFRGPRFPRWMENGVSSFNKFVHQLSVDSDTSIVDYSTGEDDSYQDVHPVATPSHSLEVSGASSLIMYDEWWTDWNRYILSWILFPATVLLQIPFFLYNFSLFRASKGLTTLEHHQTSSSPSALRVQSLKEHFIYRATDRRRGVIEDLQLAFEIFIEAIFDVVHKAAHFFLSPLEAVRILFKWVFVYIIAHPPANSEVSVPTATLGADNPTPTERTFQQSLNTDARTCRDVITELGYPYEAIQVVTSDGYVLLLERIPRHDARKAIYLQHGILDSSMGWVSNGVVGSPAFAAFDQGYDVFLGNFRGLVSREHVDKNISSRQYWGYSINEHATKDIPAMVEKIHEIKTSELKCDQPHTDGENNDEQPYNLCSICHSLGGAAILMYVITSQFEKRPHRLSRLVLLSPAGFHEDSNLVFSVLEHLVLALGPILEPIVPGLYIPTRFFRMLVNKLARDFHNYPAVGGLVQTLVAYLVGGDSSDWVGVLSLPHYNMNDMPGLSFRVSLHLAQMKRARKFVMYDYGSPRANMEVYGSPKPPDLGEFYRLINIPVHILAGQKDQVIRPSMVKKHHKLMKDSGVEVSYNEFEYAHLDFTFSHCEELLAHVMSLLHLMESAPMIKQQPVLKTISLKEEDSHVHS